MQSSTRRWNRLDIEGHEDLELHQAASLVAIGVVAAGEERYSYRATLTHDWDFLHLTVGSGDGRALSVHRSPTGLWSVDGQDRDDLSDAFDIDLSFSPFTNTLPIRRLDLDLGASAEIVCAYVDTPSLEVTTDPQRYTRLDTHLYLYESMDSDFSREITVDDDGLVVGYPGLFAVERD
ncbi:putative glycolipid-binding domain-containing protein [Georgenia sp. Z1344]|uniref:putative glycolipid-binding domain-containing protein n=1 Tax=Georgenia sp. Z1344 TaxID=3416706 RepID=UPI003CEFF687